MNVFIIPSWYPSQNNALPGIFFREQAMAMASQYKEFNFGISTWGQNDERLLLWGKKPLNSLSKFLLSNKPIPSVTMLSGENIAELFTPTYTWTSKYLNGNFKKILKANLLNLEQFEVKFGKAHIIHAHVGYPAGYIAQNLSKVLGIPYSVTEHMSPFPHAQFLNKQNKLDHKLLLAYKYASTNICVSQNLALQMNSFGIKNLITIPNLVDDLYYKPAVRSKNKIFTFFSLGRMVPQKGMDLLLTAFSKIDKEAILRIGGDGDFIHKYKRLATKLKIDHKVHWLAEIDKSRALTEYQSCDAFVLPSRHESMGVVFAEAMACGRPVIATICGGPEEFINADCGYLVEPENEKGLLQAMEKMMENLSLFDPSTIRKHFECRFSKQVVCKKIKDVYEFAVDSDRKKLSN